MESALYDILSSTKIPKMARIRQNFDTFEITDPEEAIRKELARPEITDTIKPGMTIAITAGSRGIHNHKRIIKTVVDLVKERGAHPFVVPAMGSHGGANAQGQLEVLAGFGITPEYLGCPVKSSMETVKVGESPEGHDVHIDKNAYQADGIIVVNKVKPHTAFRGPYESGLMKMMTIGLGKQYGASLCHEAGFKHMGRLVPMFAEVILANCSILFGLAIVENAYSRTCLLKGLTPAEIPLQEPGLLDLARKLMPKILFDNIAVLVIDEIGKNFSGDGQDPNVSSRFATPYASGDFTIQKVCVLDISEKSHGIMIGAGCADTCTRRLVDKSNLEASYINAITSTVFDCVRLPMILKNDYYAMAACIKTCNEVDREHIRMVRIPNTLEVGEIWISESMMEDAARNPRIEILSPPEELPFDANGNILPQGACFSGKPPA
ncbi:MAG: nickel-dependent lactate racemase [Clostridium sp.]|nr:nickel-dependent lactate racemase [Clostridium sp.]